MIRIAKDKEYIIYHLSSQNTNTRVDLKRYPRIRFQVSSSSLKEYFILAYPLQLITIK